MPRRSFPEADIGNGAQQFGGADDCYADTADIAKPNVNDCLWLQDRFAVCLANETIDWPLVSTSISDQIAYDVRSPRRTVFVFQLWPQCSSALRH